MCWSRLTQTPSRWCFEPCKSRAQNSWCMPSTRLSPGHQTSPTHWGTSRCDRQFGLVATRITPLMQQLVGAACMYSIEMQLVNDGLMLSHLTVTTEGWTSCTL
jgi:hypothetical protein